MGKNIVAAWCIGLLVGALAGAAVAETYTWTDRNGTVHFTEDLSSVPKKYRKSVGRRGDVGMSEPVSNPAGEGSDKPVDKATTSGESKVDTQPAGDGSGVYGGRRLEEWRQDFAERAARMKTIDQRIKEIEATVRKPSAYLTREQINALSDEHKAAVEKYNEEYSQYNQLMDQAKKAGVPLKISN